MIYNFNFIFFGFEKIIYFYFKNSKEWKIIYINVLIIYGKNK